MDLKAIAAYELVEKKTMPELYSEGYLLRHKKTGARVFVLENDDNNKVFYIGFRTPPSDSTGVPHIMEHSVLCGSKKFPAKDPFVELAKGSLNTFLNAMTYPDKTVYPIASCNDKDFKNLMHVYMDAVFNPNIYDREEIFRQEGWHYELDKEDGELKINGVVYNEMKGAFSNAEDMVDRKIYEALFPDTAYGLESGGDPEVIPKLTYEAFLDFHRRYYHPSNSFIYLYGDADMAERLNWLDEEYLSAYDSLYIDSELKLQKGFSEMKEVSFAYPVTEEEPLSENTFIAYSSVIDTVLDPKLYLAFQVIDYALISAPGAPLKEALMKSGICRDVASSYENGIYQPYFTIMVKNSDEDKKEKFLEIIRECLGDIVKKGINKKALEAGVNYFEFKYKESDFGSYPKGLIYGLQSLDSWLYDEKNPFMHLGFFDSIAFVKEMIDSDYFEQLIDKYLLNNPHSALIISKPERGLTAKKDAALAAKLKEYAAGLTKEERENICRNTIELKKYQEEPDDPEVLKCIPMLEIEDIKKKPSPILNEEEEEGGIRFLYHDVKSNAIGYLTLLFDLKSLPERLYPALGLIRNLLGLISTENFTYGDLINEINRKSGGVTFGVGSYVDTENFDEFSKFFEVDAKLLEGSSDFVFDIIGEILFKSRFSDRDRILELFKMLKSRIQLSLASAGHSVAYMRCMAYHSERAWFSDQVSGYEFYKYLCQVEEIYGSDPEETDRAMAECLNYILDRNNLLVDYTGSREGFKEIKKNAIEFAKQLKDQPREAVKTDFKPENKNEAFKSSSQVQYVALTGNFRKSGLEFTGALRVLKTILSYDYLWINVRVKGGAYGCMNSFNTSGDSFLVSYRDPNLSETLDIYRRTADYVENFQADKRTMTKYVIGTISDVDVPRTPKMEGNRNLAIYLSKISYESLCRERSQILSADTEEIRKLAEHMRAIIDQDYICCIGSEEKINDNAAIFKKVENLL